MFYCQTPGPARVGVGTWKEGKINIDTLVSDSGFCFDSVGGYSKRVVFAFVGTERKNEEKQAPLSLSCSIHTRMICIRGGREHKGYFLPFHLVLPVTNKYLSFVSTSRYTAVGTNVHELCKLTEYYLEAGQNAALNYLSKMYLLRDVFVCQSGHANGIENKRIMTLGF